MTGRSGQVIVLDVRGVRDVEHQTPVTLDTVFPIGSCTKAFTAMAVGLAQDEGVLSLDDAPQRWLPYFKMQDREANALVTLRDMLSHRTGLKAYADLRHVRSGPQARAIATRGPEHAVSLLVEQVGQRGAAGRDHACIVVRAVLGRALLGREVDVHDAEALREPE